MHPDDTSLPPLTHAASPSWRSPGPPLFRLPQATFAPASTVDRVRVILEVIELDDDAVMLGAELAAVGAAFEATGIARDHRRNRAERAALRTWLARATVSEVLRRRAAYVARRRRPRAPRSAHRRRSAPRSARASTDDDEPSRPRRGGGGT